MEPVGSADCQHSLNVSKTQLIIGQVRDKRMGSLMTGPIDLSGEAAQR